jgi:subtilisin family serine protease
MTDNWLLSPHHIVLGIAEIWRDGFTGKGIQVAVFDDGMAAPPGLDRGFSYYKSDGSSTEALPMERAFGHGTSCASVIASYKGGALGIAPMATLVSVEVNNLEEVEAALAFIAQTDIDIVSCSFTMTDSSDDIISSLRTLADQGKLVIASAGDDSRMHCAFPEDTPNLITVGAVDRGLTPMRGMACGDWISVYAPGDRIPVVGPVISGTQQFRDFNLTSPAAAIVSGVAALALSKFPNTDVRREKARSFRAAMIKTANPIVGAVGAPGQGIVNPKGILGQL